MSALSVCRCRAEGRPAAAECLLRQALERAVEAMLANVQALIGTLDQVDGDADHEEGADREADPDTEPDADLEPALGWPAWGGPAEEWSAPGGVDRDGED